MRWEQETRQEGMTAMYSGPGCSGLDRDVVLKEGMGGSNQTRGIFEKI